ncbi:hypothetical protein QL285_067902 [Trifolium repens]|nr:hypothetical protein QL285_067902 [Trifolium repens]
MGWGVARYWCFTGFFFWIWVAVGVCRLVAGGFGCRRSRSTRFWFVAGSLFSGVAGGGSLRPDLEFSFWVEGLGGWLVWVVLGVVVRVSSPSSSSGRYPLVFRLAATSLCRWVGVSIRIWWCFDVPGEDVVFLPAEVVVLARFWRLGVVLVLVAEVGFG